ncbi:protein CHROMATIN REMODELING 25 [Citrus sinensis]|uniref:Protein CHROMATIN REMODELING 25 n=1 Tax=Citrus sinensis TaxID=2711 RepID=A0ACB8IF84_CITSI|nr:protein CHROMATIN REMODELING 25 [Citrus sinensis]
MEDDEEILSDSDPSDSSDGYTIDREDADYNDDNDDGDDEASAADSAPSDEDRKSKNVDALVRGNLVVKRQSLLPRVLSVTEGAAVCRKPFKPPCSNGYDNGNDQLARRLCARKRFVPWGSSRPVLVTITNRLDLPRTVENNVIEENFTLPPGVDPLVLWQPEEPQNDGGNLVPITVDPLLVRFLRPHQREGVQFMFECVSGLLNAAGIHGCILADDMGLGKTLQSIALLYTLLCQGFDGKPMVKKAIIVTPTSLVSNWEAEIKKWVGGRVQLIALCESTRDDVVSGIDSFTNPCSSLQALAALSCKRRILLSGTPMQNDLEEFFAMVNFTNPGILGDAAYFRHYYETSIICGREPTATEEEKKLGIERSSELSAKVNQVKRAISEETKQSKILAYITALKKLCNHPKLIYDTIKSGNPGTTGFEDCIRFFPPEMFSGRSGSWTGGDGAWVELSGKMHVLARLLGHLRQRTDDRIVLVSNYTQVSILEAGWNYINQQKTEDEFAFLLSSKAGGCGLNLIGGNRLVLFDPDWNPANDKQAAARVWRDGQKKRVFIYRFLSTGTIEEKVYQRQMSKEGLQKVIQPEQTDSSATQGNFLSTEDLRDLFTFYDDVRSEIHENMHCTRCQNYDDGAESIGEGDETNSANENDQSDQEVTDIGGFAGLAGCLHKLKSSEKQVGTPLEEDLNNWGHHFYSMSVPDAILQASAGDEVTFVFTNQVDGKLVPIESKVSPKIQGTEGNKNLNNHITNPKPKLDQKSKLLSQHHKLLKDVPSLKNSAKFSLSASSQPKSMTTSLKGAIKPKLSFGNQLPLKRLSPDNVEHDDDFE